MKRVHSDIKYFNDKNPVFLSVVAWNWVDFSSQYEHKINPANPHKQYIWYSRYYGKISSFWIIISDLWASQGYLCYVREIELQKWRMVISHFMLLIPSLRRKMSLFFFSGNILQTCCPEIFFDCFRIINSLSIEHSL